MECLIHILLNFRVMAQNSSLVLNIETRLGLSLTLVLKLRLSVLSIVMVLVWYISSLYQTLCCSYNLAFFILTYILPLLVMGLSYLQMGRKLWGEPAIGEDTPNLARNRKSKQKVLFYLILLFILFYFILIYSI